MVLLNDSLVESFPREGKPAVVSGGPFVGVVEGRMNLRWQINLLEGGSVVTREGEYLGTWGIDESDAIYEFTPDGAAEPLLRSGFMKFLCDSIERWHSRQQSGDT